MRNVLIYELQIHFLIFQDMVDFILKILAFPQLGYANPPLLRIGKKKLHTFFFCSPTPHLGLQLWTPHAFGLRTLIGIGSHSTAFEVKSLPDLSKILLTFFSNFAKKKLATSEGGGRILHILNCDRAQILSELGT